MSFITATNNAIKEIKCIVEQQKFNIDEVYILLGVKVTHSGFSYNFHIIDNVLENSVVQNVDGVKFVLNNKFVYIFDGIKLDYISEPAKFGFVFDNPNVVENI